ncbi:MAG: hypothetical protein ABEJ99_05700 [Candidatus Nanohaloarchaea archaeon]
MKFEKPEAENQGGTKWEEDEVDKLLELDSDDDYTLGDIADEFEGRSKASVKNKLRKVKKAQGDYNETHNKDKYEKNLAWIRTISDELDEIKAFEGYSGIGNSARHYLQFVEHMDCCEIEDKKFDPLLKKFLREKGGQVEFDKGDHVRVDLGDKSVECFNEDVNNVLHRKVGNEETYNFVDLDPCGSPFVSVPQAIRLIDDGYLAVTYGDVGLKRWGRDTPLMKAYRMPAADGMWEALEYMIGWTMFEGVRQRKAAEVRKLEVVEIEEFEGIMEGTVRVLFRVEKVGILNPVMEHLHDVLEGFDEEKGPAAAKYVIDKD